MKATLFSLLLLLPLILLGQPADCPEYNTIIIKVEKALKAEDYKTALLKLNAAREHCPDMSGEVDRKILGVFDAIEQKRLEAELGKRLSEERRIEVEKEKEKAKELAKSLYLRQIKNSLAKEDIRIAWRLLEVLEKFAPNDKEIILLKDVLSKSGAKIFLEASEDFQVSPDSKRLAFLTVKPNATRQLNILELNDELPLTIIPSLKEKEDYSNIISYKISSDSKLICYLQFEIKKNETEGYKRDSLYSLKTYSLNNDLQSGVSTFYEEKKAIDDYAFSPDNRFLLFSNNEFRNIYTLNVLELGGKETIRTFTNSGGYRYSDDSHFLTFFTAGDEGSIALNELNVLELGGEKTHRTFPKSFINSESDSYRYSGDSRFLAFFTDEANGYATLNELNVLELGGEKTIRTFPMSFINGYQYSDDSRFLTFFTAGDEENMALNELNVLELGGEKTIRTFPMSFVNGEFNSYRYSDDSRFLVFFTHVAGSSTLNVLELGGEKSHRTFPDSDRESYSYSEDSRFLSFYTEVDDNGKSTLNVLELGGEKSHRTFPDSGGPNGYSKDSRFLSFCTKEYDSEEDSYRSTLNVLELGEEKPICSFNDFYDGSFSEDGRFLSFLTDVHNNENLEMNVLELGKDKLILSSNENEHDCMGYHYSKDGRFLFFYSPMAYNATVTLSVLELGEEKPIRSIYSCEAYTVSGDGRFLSFFTKEYDSEEDSDKFALNILELGGEVIGSFNDCNSYGDNDYSADSRYFAFLSSDDKKTAKILNIQNGILQEIKHQYPIDEGGFEFITPHYLLTTSTNPVTQNKIFKLIPLDHLGEGYWDYLLTTDHFKPLTKEEKAAYGITD